VCRSLGHPYYVQLAQIFQTSLQFYRVSSNLILKIYQTTGPAGLGHFNVKSLRGVKKEILLLYETYIPRSEDAHMVCSQIVPPLLDATLDDYTRSPPDLKDAEVLSLCTVIMNQFGVSCSLFFVWETFISCFILWFIGFANRDPNVTTFFSFYRVPWRLW
jgi:exportin-1